MKKIGKKFIVLTLILMLNWSGLSVIGTTESSISDMEVSPQNNFTAGVLDYALDAIDPETTCGGSTSVTITNNGNPFKYKISSSDFSNELCDYVILEANIGGGEPEYVGNLKDFDFGPLDFSEGENWEFKLSVSPDAPDSFNNQTCNFKYTFFGSQTRHNLPLGEGFNDTEEVNSRITAPVCHNSETRTIGYWKTHAEVYLPYLPQFLGNHPTDEIIDSVSDVNNVFNANNSLMRNKLKKQLLAMKFNVAHFDAGDYYIEDEGKTINEVIAEADNLLRQNPLPDDTVLEQTMKILDYWNNDHNLRICFCNDGGLVINKVYYDVDDQHGSEFDNEWVELYNSSLDEIDLQNWQLCDNYHCDLLSVESLIVPAGGYVLVTDAASTFDYWNVPSSVIKIILDNPVGDGLGNCADMLLLKNADNENIDQMNWGVLYPNWIYSNAQTWDPGVTDAPEGQMLGRVPSGFDTDQVSDFKALILPDVQVIWPNGGEVLYVGQTYDIQWTAINHNGPDSDLSVNLYYSNDSGNSWGLIAENLANTGSHAWRVPLLLGDYYVPSSQARIKIEVIGPENFMIWDWDMSDLDFCPPIDYDLLTKEEIEYLKIYNLYEGSFNSEGAGSFVEQETGSTTSTEGVGSELISEQETGDSSLDEVVMETDNSTSTEEVIGNEEIVLTEGITETDNSSNEPTNSEEIINGDNQAILNEESLEQEIINQEEDNEPNNNDPANQDQETSTDDSSGSEEIIQNDQLPVINEEPVDLPSDNNDNVSGDGSPDPETEVLSVDCPSNLVDGIYI